jgi:hypothetical protein
VPQSAYDVSLLTQLSIDRFEYLVIMCERWDGPIHVVVYATDAEALEFMQLIKSSKTISTRQNIAFHVVYRREVGTRLQPFIKYYICSLCIRRRLVMHLCRSADIVTEMCFSTSV